MNGEQPLWRENEHGDIWQEPELWDQLPPQLRQAEYCLDCGEPFELDPSDPDGIVCHSHG